VVEMTVQTGAELNPPRTAGGTAVRRPVRFRLRRSHRLTPLEETALRRTYGLFGGTADAGEPFDPALLERAIWGGLV
jgi:hypothetical protein